MSRTISPEQPAPTTTGEAWNRAINFLQGKTLLWSTERVTAARNDALVKMLHREMNYQWAKEDHATGIRVVRNWCKALLIAGREWRP